jgi:uncharacterized membrane protein
MYIVLVISYKYFSSNALTAFTVIFMLYVNTKPKSQVQLCIMTLKRARGCESVSKFFTLAAWSCGIVSAYGGMGRGIEYLQAGWSLCLRKKKKHV